MPRARQRRDAQGPERQRKDEVRGILAWRLQRLLVTISCHDDLSASDLFGRFLVRHDGTSWQDGPLTRAAREGAICYLDELVEARVDTVVVLRPLTDHRRLLPIGVGAHHCALPCPEWLTTALLKWVRRLVHD